MLLKWKINKYHYFSPAHKLLLLGINAFTFEAKGIARSQIDDSTCWITCFYTHSIFYKHRGICYNLSQIIPTKVGMWQKITQWYAYVLICHKSFPHGFPTKVGTVTENNAVICICYNLSQITPTKVGNLKQHKKWLSYQRRHCDRKKCIDMHIL